MAALVSLLTAATVLILFRRVFPTDLALLGTLLFVGGRYFVRYGAHVMADIPSAGCAAATVAAYLAARERRSTLLYGLTGVALGAAVLAKVPNAPLGVSLLVAESGLALRARRFEPRHWGGLLLAGAVGGMVFVAVQAVVFSALYGRDGVPAMLAEFGPAGVQRVLTRSGVFAAFARESWRDWGPMALVMLSGPTVTLAGIGFGLALWHRQERDLPFIAWLVVVGGVIVFGLGGHNEARYLLPAVPAILYFAVRAVEAAIASLPRLGLPRWSRQWAVGAVWVLLLAGTVAGGVQQAWHDRDPVFLSDVERRVALRLLATRRGNGRLVWFGTLVTVHTFHTRDPMVMIGDEYFDVFNLPFYAVQYFIDEPLVPADLRSVPPADLPLSPLLRDGDAILRMAGTVYDTASLPLEGVPPPEVWRIDRMFLRRVPTGFISEADPALRFELSVVGDQRTIRAERDLGRWSVRAWTAGRMRPLADVTLSGGTAAPLGGGSADGDFDRLALIRVEREVIE
jgi:hypothetical protein